MKMAGSMAPRTLPWHSLPSSPPVPHPGPSRDRVPSPFHNHSHPFRESQPVSTPAPSSSARNSTLMRKRSRPLADSHIPRPLNAPPDHPSLAGVGSHTPLPSMANARLKPGSTSAEEAQPSAAMAPKQPGNSLSADEITASAAASAAASRVQPADDTTAAPSHGSNALAGMPEDGSSNHGDADEDMESRDAATAVHASARHMREQRERERLLQEDACALYGERWAPELMSRGLQCCRSLEKEGRCTNLWTSQIRLDGSKSWGYQDRFCLLPIKNSSIGFQCHSSDNLLTDFVLQPLPRGFCQSLLVQPYHGYIEGFLSMQPLPRGFCQSLLVQPFHGYMEGFLSMDRQLDP